MKQQGSTTTLVLLLVGLGLVSPCEKNWLSGSRVVGGYDDKIEKHPYQLSLLVCHDTGRLTSKCGGAIITSDMVVTAAHCFKNSRKPRNVFVRSGSSFRDSGGTVHTVTKIMVHTDYAPPDKGGTSRGYDVALLSVKEPFIFDRSTQAIAIAPRGTVLLPETVVHISGFGKLQYSGPDAKRLQGSALRVVTNRRPCVQQDPLNRTQTFFCATDKTSMTCTGDSGGPVVLDGFLVGLVSTSKQCRPGLAGSYTDLTHSRMRAWIQWYAGV